MDPATFRQKLLAKAFGTPMVLLPGLFGMAAVAVGLAAGDFWGFSGFLGLTGIGWAIGSGLTRAAYGRVAGLARAFLDGHPLDVPDEISHEELNRLVARSDR